MKEIIKLLADLQKLDSTILERSRRIEDIPKKIMEHEAPYKAAEAALENRKKTASDVEKKRKAREKDLDELADKVDKMKARAGEIKTNKEYQAHQKEIEAIEKQRFGIEDDILAAMEAMETAAREIKKAEAELRDEKGKLDAIKKTLEAEVAEAEKSLDGLKAMRAVLAGKLDGETYNEYMNLLENKNGLAVVEIKAEICQGCNMNVPPQLYVEIRKEEEIHYCPQCGRILFYAGPSGEESGNT